MKKNYDLLEFFFYRRSRYFFMLLLLVFLQMTLKKDGSAWPLYSQFNLGGISIYRSFFFSYFHFFLFYFYFFIIYFSSHPFSKLNKANWRWNIDFFLFLFIPFAFLRSFFFYVILMSSITFTHLTKRQWYTRFLLIFLL